MTRSEPAFSADLATYVWVFGQGVLVDFTPCVFPLIPITVAVFGAKRGLAAALIHLPIDDRPLLRTSKAA